MLRDLRYALRVLGKNPGFTTAAVLTLALGIGLNATIFSIFDAMALRPLQLPGTTRALSMYQDMRGGNEGRSMIGGPSLFSSLEYAEYRDNNHVFIGLTAYTPEYRVLVDADVKPVQGELTTCDYFSVLAVSPRLGRAFSPNECASTGAGPVVVLSDAFWRNRFAADPAILGKTVKLNRLPFTVIGVAPPSFHGTEIVASSWWVPISMQYALSGRSDAPFEANENLGWLALIGRLKPGLTTSQAHADLGVIAARRDARHSGRLTTLSLSEPNYFGRADKRRAIFAVGTVFLVAVGLVLLIACANVANLFLARATARQREIAVRLAIGASRVQLVRQLLTESFLIALAGGVIGTAVSFSSATALVNVLLRNPDLDPLNIAVAPDMRIFAYSLLLVLVAAFGFGLAPALQSTRPDLNNMLRDGAEIGGTRGRLRNSLVGVQVAVSMVLLVSAGLLLRGLSHAESVDPGFAIDNAVTMSVDLRAEGYTAQRAVAFHRGLDSWLKTLPGFVAASQAFTAPLANRHYFGTFGLPGEERQRQLQFNRVSPGFFSSVGLPLVRGRDFNPSDASGSTMIVSEAAASLMWPGQNPVGKTVHAEHDYTVIGVARDAQVSELGRAHEPFLYLAASDSNAIEIGTVIVRSAAPYPTVAAALRANALALDPDLHLKIAPLRDNMRFYLQASQILATLSSALAGLALLLATIGIYGTVAFMVARRTREIGIRMALGAHSANVVRLVTRDTMRTVVIGAVVGLALCVVATRVLAVVLFGVSTLDAAAFLGVPALLLGVALVASYIPTRRAVRIDPLIALRAE